MSEPQITWDATPQNGSQSPQIKWDDPEPATPPISAKPNPMMPSRGHITYAHDIEDHPVRSELAGAAGALGAGAVGATALSETPIIGPALRWGARKIAPYAVPALASEAIHQAKEIPVIGPVIQHIPFAEMLPWMLGGKGEKGEAAGSTSKPEPEIYRPGYRRPRAYYGGQPPEPIGPRGDLKLTGEVARPIEGQYVEPIGQSAAQEPPFAPATVVTPRAPEPAPAPYRKVGGFEPEHVGPPDSTVLAGRRGVRVAKPRGLALPPAPEPETAIPPISATKPSAVNPAADLDRQLNDALGGKPLERNIPIGKQRPLGNVSEQIKDAVGPSQQPPRAPLGNLPKQISDSMNPLPEGFTSADSSAIRGYKYNPAERELEAITNTGQHYVHGDVSPEEFSKFEAAASKGKAWNDLRKAPGVTQVATVQNGSRLPTKPGVLKTAKGVIAKSKAGMDPNADLTSPLEESVKQALARKSRVARPK